MSARDERSHDKLSELDAALLHVRMWMRYVEETHRVKLNARLGEIRLRQARVTQGEIELLKYQMIRREGFREDEPIVVYHGHRPIYYIIDGHSRARVKWDEGVRRVRAAILTAWDSDLDLEIASMAIRAGGGREKGVWEISVADRLGRGSTAWAKRREDLLKKPQRAPRRAPDGEKGNG